MNISTSIKKASKYFLLPLLLIIGMSACNQVDTSGSEEGQGTPNLKAYFPMYQGMEYSYAGEGIEFAPFTRKIMFVEDKYLQFTDDNGGTVVVKIYKVSDQEINEIYEEAEFYEDDNLIPDVIKDEEKKKIILKAPLEVGNSWNNNGEKREIVAVNQKVKVPAGTFYHVVRVKITYQDNDNTRYNYFAPNIGLIKTEYFGEGFKIKSELKSFSLN